MRVAVAARAEGESPDHQEPLSSGSLTACPSSGLAGQGIWPKTEAVSGVIGLSHRGCSGTANHLDRVLSASRKTASNTNTIAEVNVHYENKQC